MPFCVCVSTEFCVAGLIATVAVGTKAVPTVSGTAWLFST